MSGECGVSRPLSLSLCKGTYQTKISVEGIHILGPYDLVQIVCCRKATRDTVISVQNQYICVPRRGQCQCGRQPKHASADDQNRSRLIGRIARRHLAWGQDGLLCPLGQRQRRTRLLAIVNKIIKKNLASNVTYMSDPASPGLLCDAV